VAELQVQDSLKTHPDCSNRIAHVSSLLKTTGSPGAAFLVSEQMFTSLRRTFFADMAEQCLRTGELSRHVYFCLQMLNQDEDWKSYAAFSLIKSFNKLYEHQKTHTIGQLIETENSMFAGEYNSLLRMLDRLTLNDILDINKALSAKYQPLLKDYPPYREELATLNNKLKNQNY